jgi:hypothetical protein
MPRPAERFALSALCYGAMKFLGRGPRLKQRSAVGAYDAVALAGVKFSGSSNRSLFRSSCRSRKRLMHIWKTTVPTDRYQTSRISKPGMCEMIKAGTAKRTSRVNELNSGGRVLPMPWKTLDVVKIIPLDMKLNEIIRRYSLPNAITRGSREKIRISAAGARKTTMVSITIIDDAMPIAE